MSPLIPDRPVVLVIAGHDPSGGAGIQADIESIASAGCHAATIITSLTAQNTASVTDVFHQEPARLEEQLNLLLDDMPVQACKIGLVAHLDHIRIIEEIIRNRLDQLPLVVDPVITAGSGHVFIEEDIRSAISGRLLPQADIITPNSIEARELSGCRDLSDAGRALVDNGSRAVLITGGHEETDRIVNTLYTAADEPREYTWERLSGKYHGSGCTLSSAIAGRLARGIDVSAAVQGAQSYTWNTLHYGHQYGQAQLHPDRFFWTDNPPR